MLNQIKNIFPVENEGLVEAISNALEGSRKRNEDVSKLEIEYDVRVTVFLFLEICNISEFSTRPNSSKRQMQLSRRSWRVLKAGSRNLKQRETAWPLN